MRVLEILETALTIADSGKRSEYLAWVCRDQELREHIEGLLAVHAQLERLLGAQSNSDLVRVLDNPDLANVPKVQELKLRRDSNARK